MSEETKVSGRSKGQIVIKQQISGWFSGPDMAKIKKENDQNLITSDLIEQKTKEYLEKGGQITICRPQEALIPDGTEEDDDDFEQGKDVHIGYLSEIKARIDNVMRNY